MQIRPILSALRRHKAGTILIALQIALTLAIVCNALFIVHERLERVHRTTGMNEANVIAVQNLYVGSPKTYIPLMKTDVQAIRSMPGVEDAYKRTAGGDVTLESVPGEGARFTARFPRAGAVPEGTSAAG